MASVGGVWFDLLIDQKKLQSSIKVAKKRLQKLEVKPLSAEVSLTVNKGYIDKVRNTINALGDKPIQVKVDRKRAITEARNTEKSLSKVFDFGSIDLLIDQKKLQASIRVAEKRLQKLKVKPLTADVSLKVDKSFITQVRNTIGSFGDKPIQVKFDRKRAITEARNVERSLNKIFDFKKLDFRLDQKKLQDSIDTSKDKLRKLKLKPLPLEVFFQLNKASFSKIRDKLDELDKKTLQVNLDKNQAISESKNLAKDINKVFDFKNISLLIDQKKLQSSVKVAKKRLQRLKVKPLSLDVILKLDKQSFSRIRDAINGFGKKPVQIKLDKRFALAEAQKVQRALAKVFDFRNLDLIIDQKKLQASIKVAKKRLQRLKVKPLPLEVRLNLDKSTLSKIRNTLKGLEIKPIQIKVDRKRAIIEARRTAQSLNRIFDFKNIEFAIDKSKIKETKREIQRLFNRKPVIAPVIPTARGRAGGGGGLTPDSTAGQLGAQGIAEQSLQGASRGFDAIRQTITAYSEFNDQLKLAGALSNTTGKAYNKLAAETQRLGIETSKTPAQAAQAAVELGKLGFAGEELRGNLEGVVRLSEATGQSVSNAARVFGQAYNVFSLSAKDAANSISALANSSAASADDVSQVLSKAGAVGKSAGQDFSTLAASFGKLRDAGFSAETAATGLKTTLLRIQSPTGKAQKALDEIGVSVRDSEGNFKDFFTILEDFRTQLPKLDKEAQDANINQIFGTRGGPVFLSLLQKSDADLKSLRTTIKSQGDAVGTAEKRLQDFDGTLRLLEGSAKTAVVQLGQGLAPVFDPLAKAALAVTRSFTKLPSVVKSVIAVSGALAVATAAAGGALVAYNLAVRQGIVAEIKAAASTAKTAVTRKAASLKNKAATAIAVANAKAASIAQLNLRTAYQNTTNAIRSQSATLKNSTGGLTGVTSSFKNFSVSAKKNFGSVGAATTSLKSGFKAGARSIKGFASSAVGQTALIGAAFISVQQAWKSARAGFAEKKELQSLASDISELGEEARQTSQELARVSEVENEQIGDSFGSKRTFLGIEFKNRENLKNIREQFGFDEVIDSLNKELDRGTNLIQEYGLTAIDSSDRIRLLADANKDGKPDLENFTSAAQAQVQAYDKQLKKLGELEPANDQQAATLETQITNIERNKSALEARIAALNSSSEAALKEAQAGRTLATSLSEVRAQRDRNLKSIKSRTSEQKADISQRVSSGSLDEGEGAIEQAEIEVDAIQDRIAANRKYVQSLKDALSVQGRSSKEGKKLIEAITEAEIKGQDLRTQAVEREARKREVVERNALDSIQERIEKQRSALSRQSSQSELTLTNREISGDISEQEAQSSRTEIAKKEAQRRVSIAESEIQQIRKARSRGDIREDVATEQIQEAKQSRLDALNEVADAELESAKRVAQAREDAEEKALNRINELRESSAQQERDRRLKLAQISTAQASGALSSDSARDKSLTLRTQAVEAQLNRAAQAQEKLDSLLQRGVISEEKYAEAKKDIASDVANAKVKQAELAEERIQAAQEKSFDKIEDREQKLANLRSKNSVKTAKLEFQAASGKISDTEATERRLALQRDALQQEISSTKSALAEIDRLRRQGLISQEEYSEKKAEFSNKLRETEVKNYKLQTQEAELANQEILDGINKRSRALTDQRKQITARGNFQKQTLGNQANLLSAQSSLIGSINSLEEQRLQKQIEQTENEKEKKSLQNTLIQTQAENLRETQKIAQQKLNLELRQQAIEAKREVRLARIAKLESEVAIRKAKANGASKAEIQSLQQISKLRSEGLNQAKSNAQAQSRVAQVQRQNQLVQQQTRREAFRDRAEESGVDVDLRDVANLERARDIARQTPTTTRPPSQGADLKVLNKNIQQLNNNLQRPNISIQSVTPTEDLLELQQQLNSLGTG